MATQWGNNSIAPNQSVGWFFDRSSPGPEGFLPVLQVMPLTPGGTDTWNLTGGGYPYQQSLGISTIWSRLIPDRFTPEVHWQMVVQNNSDVVIEYAFLEADL